MPRTDVILVECENCGHGHRWIPASVQKELDHLGELKLKLAKLEKQLRYMEFHWQGTYDFIEKEMGVEMADGVVDTIEKAWHNRYE